MSDEKEIEEMRKKGAAALLLTSKERLLRKSCRGLFDSTSTAAFTKSCRKGT